jgi:hypothetical protein
VLLDANGAAISTPETIVAGNDTFQLSFHSLSRTPDG